MWSATGGTAALRRVCCSLIWRWMRDFHQGRDTLQWGMAVKFVWKNNEFYFILFYFMELLVLLSKCGTLYWCLYGQHHFLLLTFNQASITIHPTGRGKIQHLPTINFPIYFRIIITRVQNFRFISNSNRTHLISFVNFFLKKEIEKIEQCNHIIFLFEYILK